MSSMPARVTRLLLALAVAACCASAVRADIITIMAANLTSGNNQTYQAPGIRIFQGLRPDIVLIQEFNANSGTVRDLVDEAFGPDYFYYIEHGGDQIPNGIISRFPILDASQWYDPTVWDRDFAWAIIDIPGEIDLQVVSVHLKADDPGERAAQAILLRDYVADNFDPSQFIVIGGDLNTSSRGESCVSTFNSFLEATNHIPEDQRGHDDTNEPRNRPYDWVMPNRLLDARHTDVVIGSSVYPEGLVFDSAVYTPLSEVVPVQFSDSHVTGMQHMAVMKAFEVGSEPPVTRTPTPTATVTATPVPTSSGTPSPPPTVTVTPTPGGTQACQTLGCTIEMPRAVYTAGDTCYCWVVVCNPSGDRYPQVPVFALLDVFGNYYFAPQFIAYDNYVIDVPPGETVIEVLPPFIWPENAGVAAGVHWYAAMTDFSVTRLFGEFATFRFGWQ